MPRAGYRPRGPGQYATIQAAVDAAVDGDLVLVQPGSYDGFTVVDKCIAVWGGVGVSNSDIGAWYAA
jgi:pectin methylesterase-like acyl-CoA thioesterase